MIARAGAAALGLSASLASAQEPTATAPSFEAMATRVLVDVVVTDKRHRPVLQLTRSDFQVFEDGVSREILSFAAFAPIAVATADPDQSRDRAEPSPVRLVQASTVLLVDEGHLSPTEAARLGAVLTDVLRRLTERRGWLLVLAPLSNIAFAGRLPEDAARLAEAAGSIRGRRFPQISNHPMTDSEALEIERGDTLTTKRVLERFHYLNPGLEREMESMVRARARELAAAAQARRRDTYEAIRIALRWLASQPGRHCLLLLSPGFPHDPSDRVFANLVNESLRANAPIHFLEADAPSAQNAFEGIEYAHALPPGARVAPFEAADAAAGADQLAAGTGGLRVGLSDLAAGLERVLDTTRSYYVLGYEPLPRAKPRFRAIKVKVRGKGLRVLARRGYFDEGQAGEAGSPPPPRR